MAAFMRNRNCAPRTLLIGGAGFLGSHFCARLIGAGHEVICMDSLLTGSLENVRHLLAHPRFTFLLHDVTKPIDMTCLLMSRAEQSAHSDSGAIRIDYVAHLASPALHRLSARDVVQVSTRKAPTNLRSNNKRIRNE